MNIVYEYSHLGGSEILKVRFSSIEKEIYEIVSQIDVKKTKISKEKTMRGRKLFSPKDLTNKFKRDVSQIGLQGVTRYLHDNDPE